jgi:asparagine synthase (glutamine-hydrolysing)
MSMEPLTGLVWHISCLLNWVAGRRPNMKPGNGFMFSYSRPRANTTEIFMCGIAGIFSLKGLSMDGDVIKKMSHTLVHRGPDDEGYHLDAHAHLAARRLSIIDLAGGTQPIQNRDGTLTIVYNGEVYNFREIRDELVQKGVPFATQTDTEVILHAYAQWGEDCLGRLRGMFAFCIWDSDKRELFLARDRMGIKPLYHSTLPDGTFLFASEIKALLAYPGIEKSMYSRAIDNLLTYSFNTAPHTFFKGIYQVLPAHYMKVSPRGAEEHEYWDIDLDSPPLRGDERDLGRRVRHELEKSVRYSLVADVPVAAYLSGGIDSSAVVGMYSEMSDQKVRTVSITFDGADYDEAEYSRKVSTYFDTENIEFKCRIQPEHVANLIYYLEDPLATLLNLPLFLLSSKVKESGYKVVLSGDGADEILGGYDYFKTLKAMDFIGRQETTFRKNILRRIFPGLRNFVQAEVQHMFFTDYPSPHPALPYRFLLFPMKGQLYSADYKDVLSGLAPEAPFFFDTERISHRTLMDQALYMETKMRLLNLTLPLADKMSMANSVELRPPFLDHDLVNLMFRIPDRYKMRALQEKYILKRSMRGFLPEVICERRKQPLQPPGRWFIDSAHDMVSDYLSEPVTRDKGYFEPGFIQNALQNYRNNGNMDYSGVVTVAFFIHLWDEIFLR